MFVAAVTVVVWHALKNTMTVVHNFQKVCLFVSLVSLLGYLRAKTFLFSFVVVIVVCKRKGYYTHLAQLVFLKVKSQFRRYDGLQLGDLGGGAVGSRGAVGERGDLLQTAVAVAVAAAVLLAVGGRGGVVVAIGRSGHYDLLHMEKQS